LLPQKAEACVTGQTRAILAGNTNGHPAPWDEFRELALRRGLILIEDSTEAIGSVFQGKAVGSFGDCSVFDFSQPGAIACGEGAMIVTDDEETAYAIRRHRGRLPEERTSVSVTTAVPYSGRR